MEQAGQRDGIPKANRPLKLCGQLLLLPDRSTESGSAFNDPLSSSRNRLTNGIFPFVDNRRDLGIRHLEDVVQQKSGALLWCQPFQQQQEGHGEIICEFQLGECFWRKTDWLLNPLLLDRRAFDNPGPTVMGDAFRKFRSRNAHCRDLFVSNTQSFTCMRVTQHAFHGRIGPRLGHGKRQGDEAIMTKALHDVLAPLIG